MVKPYTVTLIQSRKVYQSIACPLCGEAFRRVGKATPPTLWQHVNTFQVSRGKLPCGHFISENDRLICSRVNCHWLCHNRYRHSGCQRSLHGGKCGGSLTTPESQPYLDYAPAAVLQSSFDQETSSQSPPPRGRPSQRMR